MSVSPPPTEWSLGVPKIAMFEIVEWESRFILRINAVKNTDYIKKHSCLKFNFLQKLSGHICLPISGVEAGAPNI